MTDKTANDPNGVATPPGGAARLSFGTNIACLVTTAFAGLQLPESRVPLVWSLALLLIGAGYSQALRVGARRREVWVVFIPYVAGLIAGAGALVGMLDRVGMIAGVLLVALGFHAARRRGTDVPLTAFIGFCLLLVGRILDQAALRSGAPPGALWQPGSTGPALLLVASLVWILQLDARRTASSDTRPDRPRGLSFSTARALTRGRIAVTTLLVAALIGAAIDRAASRPTQPDPSALAGTNEAARRALEQATAAAEDGGRRADSIGLGRDFDLSGGRRRQGADDNPWSMILREDEICRVLSLDRRPLPSDVLLRFDAFDVAELERWRRSGREKRARRRWLGPFQPHAMRAAPGGTDDRRARVAISDGTDLGDSVLIPVGMSRIEAPIALTAIPELDLVRTADEGLPDGASYIVDWIDPTLDDLRTARARSSADVRIEADLAPYRNFLLATLRDLVGEDAADLARDDLPAFLERLARGLQNRCTYRLSPPRGSTGIELIDFLDEGGDRAGFCMHFASAAAVMMRLVGVPCRIAVGLAAGDRLETEGGTSRLVRSFGSQHAHAWVEIRTAAGWYAFDPSPAAATPIGSHRGWPTPSDVESAASDVEVEAGRALRGPVLTGMFGEGGRSAGVVALVLLLVSAASAASALFSRPSRGTTPSATPDRFVPREAQRDFASLLAALRTAGLPLDLQQLVEILRATSVESPQAGEIETVLTAFRAYLESRYGGRPYDDERQRAVREGTRVLRARRATNRTDTDDSASTA
jgi:hypothetical protein